MARDHGEMLGGLILVIIGLLFLLGNVYGVSVWSLFATYWPVILIIAGASILIKHWGD
ncbi:MAG: DUF5668 domain-containing protein [Candidatus Nanoarchaeia archaeon]